MSRRRRAERRIIAPDTKYSSEQVARLINKVMTRGKKSLAEGIVYKALDIVGEESKNNPLDVLGQAIRNTTPFLQVKPRRVGGATYQVPIEVSSDRGLSLSMRWLIHAARARTGSAMPKRLAAELMDASKGQGAAAKRREDIHRMAEANRAFVHYRW